MLLLEIPILEYSGTTPVVLTLFVISKLGTSNPFESLKLSSPVPFA